VLVCKLWSILVEISVLLNPRLPHGYSFRALCFDVFTIADLVGAVALFLLRRTAPAILSVVLVATVLTQAIVGSLLPSSDGGLFGLAMFLYNLASIGVSTVVVVYAWHLRKQGALR